MHWSGADCPVLVMKRCNARGAKGVGHSAGTQANGQPDEPDSTGRRQLSSSGTSRVKREFQARICERLRVQFPRPTLQQREGYVPGGEALCHDARTDDGREKDGRSGSLRSRTTREVRIHTLTGSGNNCARAQTRRRRASAARR